MNITLMKAKIHRAVVTQAEIDYVGSITIDSVLLKAAGIYAYEKVQVVDVNNGNRLETYVIPGEADSGIVCLNGAAARLVDVDDRVIIMAYAEMSPHEAADWQPSVIFVDDTNKIVRKTTYEKHGQFFCDAKME
ncbi:MAG: aspartate 1-decarboxylase [Lachnospiraceae bacterium]|nr:aspartate 1-decarboxylase [Lachnospiraceae bacterium]